MAIARITLGLLLLLKLLSAEGLIPFSVKKDDLIERVILPKSEYISRVSKATIYQGNFPKMVFRNFRRIKGAKYLIYLIDLSRDGKYFDALAYDSIEIHSDLKQFRFALADERLFKLEDNLVIASNQKRISLSPAIKGIDLQRLKYAVILSRKKLKSVEIVFQKDIPKNLKRPSYAVWAWNARRIAPKRLKELNISRVYLQVGDGFLKGLRGLKEEGIEVYALDGTPSDIDHFEEMVDKFSKLPLKSLNGIQLDVEPYLLKEYRSNRDAVLDRYLSLLRRMKEWSHRRGIALSVTLPYWFSMLEHRGKPIFPKILKELDEAVLMSYSSDPQRVVRISLDALRWGEWMGKRVDIGLELKQLPDEKHIRYLVEESSACITQDRFYKECHPLKLIRDYTVQGSSLSFYGNHKALRELLKMSIPYSSFSAFVFHDESMLDLLKSAIK